MKTKRILIAYLNNGDLLNAVVKEIMYDKVVAELVEEGREVKDSINTLQSKKTTFTDGSIVTVMSPSVQTRSERLTHLYIDESIKSTPNGKLLIETVLMPCLMMGEYEKFDTSGKQLVFYSNEDGEIKLTNLNGDVV